MHGWLSVACIMLECGFELAIPMIMADIIDIGISTRNMGLIFERGILMIGCALVSLILGYFYARYSARFSYAVGDAIRVDVFSKVQEFSFKNLDHFSTSSLITRLTSDINIIQNSIMNGIRPLFRAPVMLFMSVAFSFLINRTLTLVFLVAAPLLALCLYFIVRAIEPRFKLLQEAIDKVNRIVQENLIGMRVVKAYVREDYELSKFKEINSYVMEVGTGTYRIATLNMPLFQTIMYSTIIAILWFGGNLIFNNSMQVGALTGFLSYVLQVLNSMMMLSNVFLLVTRSLTSVVRLEEVLQEVVDIPNNIAGISEVDDGSILFRHVDFKYSDDAEEPVLSDISFAISSGTMVGIMGTTGSSKSSLVQLILRLYDVTSGSVLVGGRDVREYDIESLRDQIAIVLQKNTLFSGTIRDNLLWGNKNASQFEIEEACKTACCHDFIVSLKDGYDAQVSQGGSNFSGGQKQRLCIARALLKKPKILILDDSTSALDRATEQRIWDGLKETLPDTTKIVIAQRVTSLMDTDQILILDHGTIHAVGNHEALMVLDPLYREIYQSQQEGVLS